jgi:hypothetical protein
MNAANFVRAAALACAACVAVFSPRFARAESPWTWQRAGFDIQFPDFSPDGREIAVTLKKHIPDGGEAESIPPEEWRKQHDEREAQIRRDPRAFDPVVTIIRLADGATQRIDFGWQPAFAPDGGNVAFQFQKNPISGLRALAETMSGNDLRLWQRSTGKVRVLVVPTRGYLGHPRFAPDGKSVVFTTEEAVNGAWGGATGLGRVELATGKISFPLRRREAHGLPYLVHRFAFLRGELVAHVGIPESGGDFLADEYRDVVVAAGTSERVLFSWPKSEDSWEPRDFARWPSGGLAIYDGAWTSAAKSQPSKDRVRVQPGEISPDGRWRAREYATSIKVTEVSTGREIASFKGPRADEADIEGEQTSQSGSLADITWSPDSRRLAWIEVTGYFPATNDVLKVATIPSATAQSSSRH